MEIRALLPLGMAYTAETWMMEVGGIEMHLGTLQLSDMRSKASKLHASDGPTAR